MPHRHLGPFYPCILKYESKPEELHATCRGKKCLFPQQNLLAKMGISLEENGHCNMSPLYVQTLQAFSNIISVLDSRASCPSLSYGKVHCIVFLGQTLYSHIATLKPSVNTWILANLRLELTLSGWISNPSGGGGGGGSVETRVTGDKRQPDGPLGLNEDLINDRTWTKVKRQHATHRKDIWYVN